MRILITGFAAFVVWAFFSTWLYVDVLRHVGKSPVTVTANSQPIGAAADSLAKIYAMMPKDLTIYFGFDKFKFTPDPNIDASLKEFKSWLDKYPESMLTVTGYADLVGEKEYNENLGLERARVVEKFLEDKGFQASRIIAGSKGEDDPVGGYITDEDRAKNRRAVISIKK
jgi:outer membrane protein OmpA-like peptidoglycan-associated protein